MEEQKSTDNVQPKAVEKSAAMKKPFEIKVKRLEANVSLERFSELVGIVEMIFNAVNNQNPLYKGEDILAGIENLRKDINQYVEKD